ncbi:IucA/IucC family siderophore biosynthesis protein [Sinorhizobium numidicum]|uniref:IucA/IucC family siderophore biosynthesis protein n=1 Tax=Sinorhizobium numidicum TaxID=680248 RepID=A0ABY8CV97_9HYPH|nr:IucA/IucC family siderophore biosynthesis protein [Sinorhizobium numidicum]WEX75367.1 IucA/IucC family siderophore biosynthesis protein [Sinorhizobium numidicum]WEX81362.1 IucA/IucC family siderophore biosynthesis protein [Sinorhizobium numidicum]
MHAHNAATLTLRSLLNCVAREYPDRVRWSDRSGQLQFTLTFPDGGGSLDLPALYRSATGHHLFGAPVMLTDKDGPKAISALDAITAVIERLEPSAAAKDGRADLLNRTHSSRLLIEAALEARNPDLAGLAGDEVSFIAAEQGLIAGHGIHPCPKSREGMTEAESRRYSPEFAAGFPLRWFAVERSLFHTGHSQGSPSAEEWLKAAIGSDFDAIKARLPEGDFALLPVHPWQADHMLKDPAVAALVANCRLVDCGEAGEPWFPTSSVRTLYRPDAPFMPKLSLGVGITNSVRVNLARELHRGDDMYRFRRHRLWQDFSRSYPGLTLVPDPAYMGVKVDSVVIDGLSVSMRENPFMGADADRNVSLLAALCEHLPDRGSRLGALVRNRARLEGRPLDAVAKDWFERFLTIFVRPIFALYLRHGIAMEAHQQNIVIEIEDGYPIGVFYRDNQGFFHHERAHKALVEAMPGLGEASESVFGEEPVDERLLYYAFINSVLGMIGALGREGLVGEIVLLDMLRNELLRLEALEGANSRLVRKMLAPTLQCKANLKTRIARLDELVGPLETQSVYLEIVNPLLQTEKALADA